MSTRAQGSRRSDGDRADPGSTTAPGVAGTDLTIGYRREPVVHGVSVAIHPARTTALVGPNGSGKSTVLRALARLHRPESGSVTLHGAAADLLSARDFAHHVTLLAQTRPSPTGISVRDVVGFGRHPHRNRWSGHDPDGPAAIEWAMAVTGIEAMGERAISDLSGGEQQRVWLATCLAQQTDILLLDEPTTYLDLRYQVEILDLVRDLSDAHGVGVGIVLHDLQQAADIADQVVLLDHGRVVATGSPHEVLTGTRLSDVYGIRIDVAIDADGSLTIRPIGGHRRPRVA